MPALFEIGGIAVELTKAALDATELRHLVLANNVANAGSSDYVPFRVSFEEQLQLLKRGDLQGATAQQRIPPPRVEVDSSYEGVVNSQVMLDFEAAKIAQNVVHYQALVRGLGKRMEVTALAISDGRR